MLISHAQYDAQRCADHDHQNRHPNQHKLDTARHCPHVALVALTANNGEGEEAVQSRDDVAFKCFTRVLLKHLSASGHSMRETTRQQAPQCNANEFKRPTSRRPCVCSIIACSFCAHAKINLRFYGATERFSTNCYARTRRMAGQSGHARGISREHFNANTEHNQLSRLRNEFRRRGKVKRTKRYL